LGHLGLMGSLLFLLFNIIEKSKLDRQNDCNSPLKLEAALPSHNTYALAMDAKIRIACFPKFSSFRLEVNTKSEFTLSSY
jgi:hypothetical protein